MEIQGTGGNLKGQHRLFCSLWPGCGVCLRQGCRWEEGGGTVSFSKLFFGKGKGKHYFTKTMSVLLDIFYFMNHELIANLTFQD